MTKTSTRVDLLFNFYVEFSEIPLRSIGRGRSFVVAYETHPILPRVFIPTL